MLVKLFWAWRIKKKIFLESPVCYCCRKGLFCESVKTWLGGDVLGWWFLSLMCAGIYLTMKCKLKEGSYGIISGVPQLVLNAFFCLLSYLLLVLKFFQEINCVSISMLYDNWSFNLSCPKIIKFIMNIKFIRKLHI